MEVTEITRLDLIDELMLTGLGLYGAMSELDFLGRLTPLESLPSSDSRFATMTEDVTTHRISFSDWGDDWIWTDSRLGLAKSEVFLKCLCLMISPIARRRQPEVESLLELFNRHLAQDGIEIVGVDHLQNRTVYGARPVGGGSRLQDRKHLVTLGVHVAQQIERLRKTEEDPVGAIGAAKDLLETVSKTVLRANGKTYEKDEELPKLAKRAIEFLEVVPPDFSMNERATKTIERLLSNFTNVAHCLAELRNISGAGHGKEATFDGLGAAYARLAADSAITFAAFVVSVSGLREVPVVK